MISRLQREDPSIRPGQPIPMSKLIEGFERMRGSRGGDDRGGIDPRQAARDALEVELLVPGFGEAMSPPPVLGFGPAAELLSVTVTAEDERAAADLLRRYDRNRNGMLDADELGRFSGNPLDFDRNRDGKLSVQELAIRNARRREAETQAREENRRNDRRDRREEPRVTEVPDPYNGRTSFRMTSTRGLPEGLPGWFEQLDRDGDGQVAMSEYAERWTDSLVEEFLKWDANGDGVITPEEALRGVENGFSAPSSGGGGGGGGYAGRSGGGRTGDRDSGDGGRPASGDRPGPSGSDAGPPVDIANVVVDERTRKYAEAIIKKNDKNGDGVLTASEWESMLMNPSGADFDRDGRITVDEYAAYLSLQRQKD